MDKLKDLAGKAGSSGSGSSGQPAGQKDDYLDKGNTPFLTPSHADYCPSMAMLPRPIDFLAVLGFEQSKFIHLRDLDTLILFISDPVFFLKRHSFSTSAILFDLLSRNYVFRDVGIFADGVYVPC